MPHQEATRTSSVCGDHSRPYKKGQEEAKGLEWECGGWECYCPGTIAMPRRQHLFIATNTSKSKCNNSGHSQWPNAPRRDGTFWGLSDLANTGSFPRPETLFHAVGSPSPARQSFAPSQASGTLKCPCRFSDASTISRVWKS